MFEFMFGWRKASKCKKLIKKVRFRLDLLINKRSCIVTQLRNDVAQLIKDGHYQTAFDRVDQIYRDECIVAAYELLDHFCEFISLQFSYIRRNKECPHDINEAISSIIFASARCGNLPELLQIRKLFSERYGERFERTALELLPGNLVNVQIRENLSIKYVPNEVKYRVIEEITASVEQNGPLALEFASEEHQQATNSNVTEQISFSPNRFHFDRPHRDPSIIDPYGNESSSENSTVNVAEEVIYLDDVVEFQSPLHSGKNGTDQRVFIFRPSVIVLVEENPKTYESIPSFGSRKRSAGYQNLLLDKRTGDLGICSRDYCFPRAVSMPCKRWMNCVDEYSVKRSNSLPVEASPPHVHPKLPEYDELAAMFTVLKKEHLQNQK